MRSFAISTGHVAPRRWCWVRIHDTVEDLRSAKARLNPAYADPEFDPLVFACWQPTSYLRSADGSVEWPSNGYAGLIRLAQGHVAAEIVAHELVHAALAVYRMNVKTDARFGRDVGLREEQFAYIYGELYADLEANLT